MLLAAKQYRDRLLLAPSAVGGMNRGAAAAGASEAAGPSDGSTAYHVAVGGGMAGRLARLTQLTQRGVLTAEQVSLGEGGGCAGDGGGDWGEPSCAAAPQYLLPRAVISPVHM